MEELDEKKLIDKLRDLFWGKRTQDLKKIYAKVNLATKKYEEIWSSWWKGELPPRIEVDLIPVFADGDEVIVVGVEVELFREGRRNPYKGLEQALSFGLFGFDSLVLWHVFSPKLEEGIVDSYVKPVEELVEGLDLPLVYLATKALENDRFELFSPLYSSYPYEPDLLLNCMKGWCKSKRNPLLSRSEVQKRRSVLRIILKIPERSG